MVVAKYIFMYIFNFYNVYGYITIRDGMNQDIVSVLEEKPLFNDEKGLVHSSYYDNNLHDNNLYENIETKKFLL